MSGRVVYAPKVCRCHGRPNPAEFGTVWLCDECGTYWRFSWSAAGWIAPSWQARMRRKYGAES